MVESSIPSPGGTRHCPVTYSVARTGLEAGSFALGILVRTREATMATIKIAAMTPSDRAVGTLNTSVNSEDQVCRRNDEQPDGQRRQHESARRAGEEALAVVFACNGKEPAYQADDGVALGVQFLMILPEHLDARHDEIGRA